jgi:hypothetical protein
MHRTRPLSVPCNETTCGRFMRHVPKQTSASVIWPLRTRFPCAVPCLIADEDAIERRHKMDKIEACDRLARPASRKACGSVKSVVEELVKRKSSAMSASSALRSLSTHAKAQTGRPPVAWCKAQDIAVLGNAARHSGMPRKLEARTTACKVALRVPRHDGPCRHPLVNTNGLRPRLTKGPCAPRTLSGALFQ